MSEVDKVLAKQNKLKAEVKKALAVLNKTPGDKKIVQMVQAKMKEWNALKDDYAAAAKVDKKTFDDALADLS